MQRSKTVLCAVVLCLGLTTLAGASVHATSPISFDEALAQAKTRGMPVLLEFYTEWWRWCKKFAREAKADPELKSNLEQVVLYMLDAEKGEGRGLAKRYGVSSYPTFQLVNAEGATISRWIGYDKAEVMENVDAGVADPTPIEARRARFERKARSADALALGRYHRALMDYARAGDFLRQAQELAEDPAVDHRYEIFETQVLGYRSNSVPLDAVREAADAVVAHERRAPEHVVRVAAHMTQMGRAADDPDLMDAYLKAAMEVTENTDDDWLQSARGELEIEHALFVLDDAARGVALRKKMMPEGWQDDAEQLNNFAWWCAENGVNLEEAAVLAEKAIELAENRRTKANVLDTLAEIRHAQGDHAGAVRSIEAALEEAPNWSHLSKQLARFKQAAAEQRLNDE